MSFHRQFQRTCLERRGIIIAVAMRQFIAEYIPLQLFHKNGGGIFGWKRVHDEEASALFIAAAFNEFFPIEDTGMLMNMLGYRLVLRQNVHNLYILQDPTQLA